MTIQELGDVSNFAVFSSCFLADLSPSVHLFIHLAIHLLFVLFKIQLDHSTSVIWLDVSDNMQTWSQIHVIDNIKTWSQIHVSDNM